MTADKETPVEELIEAHHEAMKERVRGQLKKLIKEISEEDNNVRI